MDTTRVNHLQTESVDEIFARKLESVMAKYFQHKVIAPGAEIDLDWEFDAHVLPGLIQAAATLTQAEETRRMHDLQKFSRNRK